MLYKRHFNELACTEREDEGPVAYVTTWLVNGHRFPRCQLSRVVRLRSDGAAWQRSLTDAWRDRLDLRLRVNFSGLIRCLRIQSHSTSSATSSLSKNRARSTQLFS